jgi:hypothetical protein
MELTLTRSASLTTGPSPLRARTTPCWIEGPHDGAVGEKHQIVGHTFGCADECRDCAGLGIDPIDAVTDLRCPAYSTS